jgi:hypothetical protein
LPVSLQQTGLEEGKPVKIVFAVHGTWPAGFVRQNAWAKSVKGLNGDSKRGRLIESKDFWFTKGSDFYRAVDGDSYLWIPFRWSGENSFHARSYAGRFLAEYIKLILEGAPPTTSVAIVAHSHGGGSVAAIAARKLSEDQCSRLTIIALASPFCQPISPLDQPVEAITTYRLIRLGLISISLLLPFIIIVASREGHGRSVRRSGRTGFDSFGPVYSQL